MGLLDWARKSSSGKQKKSALQQAVDLEISRGNVARAKKLQALNTDTAQYKPVTKMSIAKDTARGVGRAVLNLPQGARAISDAIVSRQMQPQIEQRNQQSQALNNAIQQAMEIERRRGNTARVAKLNQLKTNGASLERDVLGRNLTTPQEGADFFGQAAGLALGGRVLGGRTVAGQAGAGALSRAMARFANRADTLRPLERTAAWGITRGAQNAAIQAPFDALANQENQGETTKRFAQNLVTGAVANTLFSPRMSKEAVADFVERIRIAQKAGQYASKFGNNVPGTRIVDNFEGGVPLRSGMYQKTNTLRNQELVDKMVGGKGARFNIAPPGETNVVRNTYNDKNNILQVRTDNPEFVDWLKEFDIKGPKRASVVLRSGGAKENATAANIERAIAKGAKVQSLPEDQDLKQIAKSINMGTKKQRVPATKRWQELKTSALNRFQPIEDLTRGKNLAPSEDPYTLVKRFTGGGGIANAKIDYELSPIVKEAGEGLDDLRSLMVAERANELAGRGIGKGADTALTELRSAVGDAEFTRLQGVAEKLRAYQDKLLQEWKNVGGISSTQYDAIRAANQKYVPFSRVMDDLDESGFIGGGSLNSSKQPISKIKGSERDIIDPIESIIKNTYEMTKAVEKNRAMRALVSLEGVATPVKNTNGKPTISVFEDGSKKLYAVDKSVADAVKGIDEEHLNLAVQAMALPARALRAGATGLNIGFAVPNVIRDQLTAAVNSKYGGVPMYDFISGLASVLKQDDAYKRWMLSGADQASFFSQDRTTLQRTVKEVVGGKKATLGRLIKNPLELMRTIGEVSEKGTRVGVFKRALKGAENSNLNEVDASLTAMRESREATIDFAQRGSKMKAANALIPFLNARTQGSLKLLQSFKDRPVRTGVIGMSLAGIPAAILYAHNSKDERYKEIPDYIRDENFIIMQPGNDETPFIKVPKGEIGKIFGNPVENFLAKLSGEDSKSWAQVSGQLLGGLSPVQSVGDAIPTAVKVPLEVSANYDTFRDRNIVSPFKKDLPPELQTSTKNTETAKWLGEKFGVSPAKLEHVIRGLGAGVAGQALQASDYLAFGKTPEKQDLPVLDRFMGESNDLSNSATAIYKKEEERKRNVAVKNDRTRKLIVQAINQDNKDLLSQAETENPDYFKRGLTEVLKDIEAEGMTPTQRAINSLPKGQQESYGVTDESAEPLSSVERGDKAKAAGSTLDAAKELSKKKKDSTSLATELTFYKNKGDLDSWMKTAEQQYNTYQKELAVLKPEINQKEIMAVQNKVTALLNQAAKYSKQKGFKAAVKVKKAKKPKKVKTIKVKSTKLTSSKTPKAAKIKITKPKLKSTKLATNVRKVRVKRA